MTKMLKIGAVMALHLAALQAKMATGAAYEKRDDVSLVDLVKKLDEINTTMTEYRKTNDARIKAVEEGRGTGDLDAKLAKFEPPPPLPHGPGRCRRRSTTCSSRRTSV